MFLIRELFADQTYFEVTGEKDDVAPVQLDRIVRELSRVFYDGRPLASCASWSEAFERLFAAVEDFAQRNPRKPIVVFLDELPWLATHRSGLMQALDHAWNARLSKIKTLRLFCAGAPPLGCSRLLRNTIGQKAAARPREAQGHGALQVTTSPLGHTVVPPAHV
jgi:hypothetical protein